MKAKAIMVATPRKKSPRAPSIALDEALERVLKAYDKERLHAAPAEVVAQNLGYKSANNGTALSALASLRYFGLLKRPSEGFLAVTSEVEAYKFAPDDRQRRSALMNFLRSPPLYAELLEKYQSGLPSDPNLKFELIQRGFIPQAANAALLAFKRSVEFAGYFGGELVSAPLHEDIESSEELAVLTPALPAVGNDQRTISQSAIQTEIVDEQVDRIPVRLPGGRRAWLLIPTPFFVADKVRLKAQIDLLLTQDEEM